MQKQHFPLILPFVLLLLGLSGGCSIFEGQLERNSQTDHSLIDELKKRLPEEIVAYNPSCFYPEQTKSESEFPVMISPEDLDYGSASTFSNDRYDYVQIPVSITTPLSITNLQFPEFFDGRELSDMTHSKTFLVSQTSRDSSRQSICNMITIIPHPDYMSSGALDSLDFFYEGFFNAVFFYANLEGDMRKVETYVHGKPYKRGVVKTPVEGDTVIVRIHPPQESVKRMGDDDIILDWGFTNPVIVVADRIDKNKDWNNWDSNNPEHPSNNHGDKPKEHEDEIQNPHTGGGSEIPTQYTISIEIEGRGSAEGSGTYLMSQEARCVAHPEVVNGTVTSEFIRWSGDGGESTAPAITVRCNAFLSKTINLTAHFHNIDPCGDSATNRRDPLYNMKVQGSGAGGWNIKGGFCGDSVRTNKDGTPKAHKGMDFACPVGTPVMATHDGVVTAVRDDIVPGDTWTSYKNNTSRDCKTKNLFNAGNAIEIKCNINGKTYTTKYYHLTDVYVSKGDVVKFGQLIGTSGITGNAVGKNCGGSHLHYQVHDSSGQWINPEPFIYTIFNNKGKQTNPC